ncbi:ATP-binding protein [Desulfobacterales bacterium HSG17]|nr:ATP-binding protein [Desulfobacterales bacterium HSG17]
MSKKSILKNKFRVTLLMKVCVMVVLTSTIILTFFGYYQYRQSYNRINNFLDDTLVLSAERMEISLKNPLFDYDYDTITSIISAEMKSRLISGVFIINKEEITYGFSRNKSGEIIPVTAIMPDKGHRIAQREIQKDDYMLGQVKVFVTTRFLELDKRRLFISILARILILDIMIAMALTLFTKIILLNPLYRVVDLIQKVSEGNFSEISDTKTVQDSKRKDEVGIITGAVLEMKDRIFGVLNETNSLICAVQEGRLDVRGNSTLFKGGWCDLINGVNNIIDAFIIPINITAKTIDRIAEGDIPEKIKEEFKGDFNEIKRNLNTLIDVTNETTRIAEEIAVGNLTINVKERSDNDRLMKALDSMIKGLKGILNETKELIETVRQGRLDVRGNAQSYEGGWEKLVSGINSLIDALTGPINKTAEYIERISKGDIPEIITENYKGNFNDIKNNLNVLIIATQEITQTAQEIAGGNLMVKVEKRSEHDAMIKAFESMIAYIQDVADITEKVSNNQLQVKVSPKSDHDVLNHSLQRMVANLQQMMEDIESSMNTVQQQNWFKTGLAELSNKMRGEQEATGLAENIITWLANYLNAQIGAIYLEDNNKSFYLASAYAWQKQIDNSFRFAPGDGLPGQAALEKKSILFSEVPDDYIQISSGLGKTKLNNILVFPFIYEGDTKGILELGTAHEFKETDMEFLTQASEDIAIAFNTAQTRGKMNELLEATRQQAEELRIQQEELSSTNQELSIRSRAIEQKNEALKQAQLKVEQKAQELEMASKYKSEFLANMSHELRTPLNSILILSQLLSRNESNNLTDKQAEFASTIHNSGSDLLSLINEILDLSKVEAGKIELHVEEVNLKAFKDDILQLFSHVAKDKGVKFISLIDDDIPEIMRTDSQRLKQVIRNLLSNAFKFTRQGHVSLKIFRPPSDTNLSQSNLDNLLSVGFSVSDTGIGIPEEKKAAIFEAFQQAEGSTSRRFGGTGLGLSISKEFSRLLGGEIQVQSQEGKGSTFTLYLPEISEHENSGEHKSESSEKTGKEPDFKSEIKPIIESRIEINEPVKTGKKQNISMSGKKILIVDDDMRNVFVLTSLLEEKNFEIIVGSDGKEALEQLDHNPDTSLVFMDIMMPEMDGYEATEKIRKQKRFENLPVIALTAKAMKGDNEKCINSGANAYLTKPVDIDSLFELINKWI